eukprot:TRINITY_DN2955_c0_g1_i18.p1 TRINITY_DN2955_c0_g1~~TRINITY_DN2955_c0_g1_i18.p1  ORF type:complete len:132 (-),score=25.13 TRINITY_DN2955_c0_g1_i18:510-905(-)
MNTTEAGGPPVPSGEGPATESWAPTAEPIPIASNSPAAANAPETAKAAEADQVRAAASPEAQLTAPLVGGPASTPSARSQELGALRAMRKVEDSPKASPVLSDPARRSDLSHEQRVELAEAISEIGRHRRA